MTTSERMKVGQHMCSIHTKKPEQALASRKPMRTVLAVSRQQFCSMVMLFPHTARLFCLFWVDDSAGGFQEFVPAPCALTVIRMGTALIMARAWG